MAEAIYSERACALKTPHEDRSISTACADNFAQCAGRPCDGNGRSTTATMDTADRQLLAMLLFFADAADGAAMPVEAAEGLLERLMGQGDRLVAFAEGEMIGGLIDLRSDMVLSDRTASSSCLEQQA